MAVLTDSDRIAVWEEVMRDFSNDLLPVSISKTDLRAAIDAVDQWVNDNSASYNTALPAAARNNLTASQKAALLMYVVAKRFNTGA